MRSLWRWHCRMYEKRCRVWLEMVEESFGIEREIPFGWICRLPGSYRARAGDADALVLEGVVRLVSRRLGVHVILAGRRGKLSSR